MISLFIYNHQDKNLYNHCYESYLYFYTHFRYKKTCFLYEDRHEAPMYLLELIKKQLT